MLLPPFFLFDYSVVVAALDIVDGGTIWLLGANSSFSVELLCVISGASRAACSLIPAKRLPRAGKEEPCVSGFVLSTAPSVSICILSAAVAAVSRAKFLSVTTGAELLPAASGSGLLSARVAFGFFAFFLSVEPSPIAPASAAPGVAMVVASTPSADGLGVLRFLGCG